tara:strand:- start:11 stop:436 length:426 start_codon:yes stop_codon:yes gene_type:complete
MKIFAISALTIFISSLALADYTMENVYKLENIDMIKNSDGSNVMNLTVNGVTKDSNGNKATLKCIISGRNGVIKGNCQGTDQDGDIEYSYIERDMTKGPVGQIKRTGGTGKYANKSATCEYTIIMADFKLGAGYLTGTCKE